MSAKSQNVRPARMNCWNCPRYCRPDRRCLDGKANPKKKADSVAVAETLGLRALCHYNLYRDALAARTHFPNTPLGIHSVPPKRSRRPQEPVVGHEARPVVEIVPTQYELDESEGI